MRPLTLLLIASLILPLATAGAATWHSRVRTIEGALASSLEMARVLREHALRTFEAQSMAIAWIDSRMGTRSWEEVQAAEDIHLLLRRITESSPHIDGLWLVRPEGRTVNSADYFPMDGTTDVTGREYYRALKDRDVLHLGEMIRGYLKGNLNFNISRRRTSPDGSFNGLILVTSSLSYFEEFWTEALPPQGHALGIVGEDGKFLVRWPTLDEIPSGIPAYSPFHDKIKTRSEGTYTATSLADGMDRLYGFTKLGSFPAYMVVGVDKHAALAPWRQQVVWYFGIAAVITLALAGVALMALRRDRQLSEEIGRRQTAESTLIAKEEHLNAISRAEAALRASEQRFRTLFDSLVQGVVFIDRDGLIAAVNPAAEQILGVPAAEITGRTVGDLEIGPVDADGRELPPDQRPSAVALRTGMILNGVLVGIDRADAGAGGDRERRWLMADAIPLRRPGEEEPSSVCILFSDITEKRRADEAQRILMREVDHRAKNALAVAQALVRLTRAGSHDEFVSALEGRIAALARAHTLLARSHWRGALLSGLLEEELEPYRAKRGEHIALDGPPVTLDPYAAQPVGMVLHELATNAAKHGALSRPEGRLEVRWWLDRRDREALCISWVERDGPAVTVPERRGFGSDLITASITSQLGGQVECDWDPAGLRATITLPLSYVRAGRPGSADAPADPQVDPAGPTLPQGLRVLVVEDNALVAMQMVGALSDLGCVAVGPAATVERAAHLAATEPLDAAVLDVDLQGQSVFPAAEALTRRGVPFLFATGFSEIEAQPTLWPDAPLLRKPISERQLADCLAALTSRKEAASPAS